MKRKQPSSASGGCQRLPAAAALICFCSLCLGTCTFAVRSLSGKAKHLLVFSVSSLKESAVFLIDAFLCNWDIVL